MPYKHLVPGNLTPIIAGFAWNDAQPVGLYAVTATVPMLLKTLLISLREAEPPATITKTQCSAMKSPS